MSGALSSTFDLPGVPAHVPPGLAREFRFEAVAGADKDAVQAAVDAVRDGPDIFYGLGARRGAGAWVVTRHELIREVFQDAERFSSLHNADFSLLIGEDWPLLPLEADPPVHAQWRILLNPIFAPARMKALEEQIDGLAVTLVEGLRDRGGCEFVKDFAEIFPVQIFLRMFGLPLEDTAGFMAWETDLIHGLSMEQRQRGARAIVDYLRKVIAERRAAPSDDLISYVAGAEVAGRALSDDEALGVCFLLYSAGLDTVANMLGFIFKHLAEHPDQQQQLRDDPELIPQALEEFLRAYPIVVSGRLVTRDLEFHGVKMKAGDVIALGTMFAGRDDQEFAEPDTVDFGREKVSHITFAAGPHRCVGSHLARRELRIALEEWLKHIPPFHITPGETPITHGIGVFGLERLPLSW
ncbi:MAG: putative cytochrome [Phenylobacterium sp.]|nr:putative cytochrome [Phenylobacterium sp.]